MLNLNSTIHAKYESHLHCIDQITNLRSSKKKLQFISIQQTYVFIHKTLIQFNQHKVVYHNLL